MFFIQLHTHRIDELEGEDYIPLAPIFTFTAGLSIKEFKRFSGSVKTRYLGDRSANEDNSVIAKGYFIADFSVNYRYRKMSIGVNIDNFFNTKWKETQFLTESRLYNETASVEEIHFTPGTPFGSRVIVKYHF